MNILYLCTFYHQAMLFRDSMNALEKYGHNTLAFNAVFKGASIEEKYIPIMDEKVVHKECFNFYDRYLYFYKQKKIYKALLSEINVKDFNIIHSHTLMNGGWVVNRIKRKESVPYVVSIRNTDLNDFLKFPFFIPIARKIVTDANAVMFLSEAYKKQFIAKLFKKNTTKKTIIENKCFVIPNGLESFWIDNIWREKKVVDSVVHLICVGTIDQNKNMISIIRAMEILKNKGVFTKLTVVGKEIDMSIYSELQKYENVSLIPFLPKEELINYYRESDIFVLPSFKESFGRVYAEAMTQGLPVIYTRNQGFDGLFSEGNVGYSVDSHNPDTIADAILKILNNYSEISKNCINNCKNFDWSIIAKKLEQMYEKSLSKV